MATFYFDIKALSKTKYLEAKINQLNVNMLMFNWLIFFVILKCNNVIKFAHGIKFACGRNCGVARKLAPRNSKDAAAVS